MILTRRWRPETLSIFVSVMYAVMWAAVVALGVRT